MIFKLGVVENVRHSKKEWSESKQDSNGNTYTTIKNKNSITFRINGEHTCYYESVESIKIEEADNLYMAGFMKKNEFILWGYKNLNIQFNSDKGVSHFLLISLCSLILVALFIYLFSNLSQFTGDLSFLNIELPVKAVYFGRLFIYTIIFFTLLFSYSNFRKYFKHLSFRKQLKYFNDN